MDKFCIWIVSPPGYTHSHTFDELALALSGAFHELGMEAPIVNDPNQITGRPIIFGANLLANIPSFKLPPGSIIYNAEQVTLGSTWFKGNYLNMLRDSYVWDYSQSNLRELKKMGVKHSSYCGLGYSSNLSRIKTADVQDIDVLFYGSMNERRKKIIDSLRQAGLRAGTVFNCYGEERDGFIARAKIVINIHYYETKVFEVGRISYLLANKIFIISEDGLDLELEAPYKGCLVFTPYDNLVNECLKYVNDAQGRAEVAESGFHIFEKMKQSTMLEEALKSLY